MENRLSWLPQDSNSFFCFGFRERADQVIILFQILDQETRRRSHEVPDNGRNAEQHHHVPLPAFFRQANRRQRGAASVWLMAAAVLATR